MGAGPHTLRRGGSLARILLVMPKLPQQLGEPYLGQRYLAAALLNAGHEVLGVDLAARRWIGGEEKAVQLARDFQPHIVGMTLFTHNALAGYRLLPRLRGSARLTVAGGPHVTGRAQEALDHGFDMAVTGEGELALVHIADAQQVGASMSTLSGHAGIWLPGRPGQPARPLSDLDAVPVPMDADGCWRPAWYGDLGQLSHSGTVTSRGCPARCTFCANHVTGRLFRWRGAAHIVAELRRMRRERDMRHFAFWDDAFTANRPRTRELCAAITSEADLRDTTWSCITPANMVRPPLLKTMADAGCVALNFGIESGDPAVLKAIGKGQLPAHVHEAVRAASALGIRTVVNFMFGFPSEGLAGLERTAAFMADLTSVVDFFNPRGVLVPLPATPIYETHHKRFGFTDWWLRPQVLEPEPMAAPDDLSGQQRLAEIDPALEWNFFGYSEDVRRRIAELVRFKARHNASSVARMRENVGNPVAPFATGR